MAAWESARSGDGYNRPAAALVARRGCSRVIAATAIDFQASGRNPRYGRIAHWIAGHLWSKRSGIESRSVSARHTATSPRSAPRLGRYRVTTWESGVEMESARFDDYFLGRPPLDTVTVRFLGDPNTMVANLMANGIDVAPTGIEVDAADELRKRSEGSCNQVEFFPRGNLRFIAIQHQPEYALPRLGLTNRGGYVNPQLDQLIDRFVVTTDERERLNLHRQLLQTIIGDVALMPLIWEVDLVAMPIGVSGPVGNGGVSTWNIYRWDKQPA
jgi:ABC-type transport system substrate-binding protein